jgi:hypothetical protein
MRTSISLLLFHLPAAALVLVADEAPVISGLTPGDRLSWDDGTTNGIAVVEWSENLEEALWSPVFYDPATNTTRTVQLPQRPGATGFYRIQLRSEPSDPSLLAHFTFDSELSTGLLLDSSGQGNHAYAVPRFGSITNWPKPITGVDGGRGGLFQYYYDGWSLGRSGDYAAITDLAPFRNLTNATVAVWIYYHEAPGGNYLADANATAVSAGYAVTGSWDLGRTSSDYTRLTIYTNNGTSGHVRLNWPDRSHQTGGDSGGWHHYAFTFSQGTVRLYYDGAFLRESVLPLESLSVANHFLGIGCKTHNGDPQLEEGTDIYPNHGWLNGRLDDIRIYRRELSADEIAAVYAMATEAP